VTVTLRIGRVKKMAAVPVTDRVHGDTIMHLVVLTEDGRMWERFGTRQDWEPVSRKASEKEQE
jgi:hypothetical protein